MLENDKYFALQEATIFISDLHISPYNPVWEKLLLPFLKEIKGKVSTLYILGDLFDWWIGEDIETAFQKSVQSAFKDLTDHGTKLFFVAGNRDFLLTKEYLHEAQCERLNDPTVIDLFGIATVLTHGDKLCTQDLAYQRYRRLAHSRFIRWLIPKLPRQMRLNIAEKLRAKSQRYQKAAPMAILDVHPEAVMDMIEISDAKQMIHGHVHRFAKHDHTLGDGTQAQRFVLGDWGKNAPLIIATPQGLQRATYTPEEGIVAVPN